MAYRMFIAKIEDTSTDLFEVSEIVHNIEYTTSLESQPGKLSFMLEKDTSNVLDIRIGSPVQFTSDGKGIFYGNIFTIETDSTDVYRVVAYDKMRYLKNSDCILCDETHTLETLFKKILDAYNLQGNLGKWKNEVKLQPLVEHYFNNETLFDILEYYMMAEIDRLTKNATSTSVYKDSDILVRPYLRCNYNKIEMGEIMYDFLYDENGKKRTEFLQIGDESLMTDYRYKVDIDKDTYNRFIFVYNEKSSNSKDTNTQVEKKQMFASMDAGHTISNTNTSLDGTKIGENTLSTWGVLTKIIELKSIEQSNMLDEYMKACVEIYSMAKRTLKINAIGYDGIKAGSGFYLHITKLGIDYPVYVVSATHRYDAESHTMELEVSTNDNMRMFL